jgi:LEA14-like dessication related protein
MVKIASLLCLCLMCIGCSALNVKSPTARVTGMDLRDMDTQGFTMNFAVDLANPNAVALPLAAVDYKLDLAGTGLANGQMNPGKSIPANGSQAVAVPVRLTYSNLLAAEQAIRKVGWTIPYKLAGGVAVDTGSPLVGQLRVPLEYSGELPLKKLLDSPMVLLQSSAARQLAQWAAQGLLSSQGVAKPAQ